MSTEAIEVKNADPALDQRLIKALAHPLRERILQALNENVASPAQLARALDEPLGNVSYHVKILLECEAIELVRTAPVRGAIEHFYRATMRAYLSDDDWDALPLSVRRGSDSQNLRRIWDDVAAAVEQGGFDDHRTHISWTNLDLDEEGHEKFAKALLAFMESALEIQAEVRNRDADLTEAERDRQARFRTELAMLYFLRAANGDRAADTGS
jgi:DNA-binding transcriptional ArsR family regulator